MSEPQALRHARRLGRNKHTRARAPVEPSDLRASARLRVRGFVFGCVERQDSWPADRNASSGALSRRLNAAGVGRPLEEETARM